MHLAPVLYGSAAISRVSALFAYYVMYVRRAWVMKYCNMWARRRARASVGCCAARWNFYGTTYRADRCRSLSDPHAQPRRDASFRLCTREAVIYWKKGACRRRRRQIIFEQDEDLHIRAWSWSQKQIALPSRWDFPGGQSWVRVFGQLKLSGMQSLSWSAISSAHHSQGS
jgi:hypothetical protein